MTPAQVRTLYHRLNSALNIAEAQANTVFNTHTVNDWLKVFQYAVKHSNTLMVKYLLTSEAITGMVALADHSLLKSAYASDCLPIVKMLMNIPAIKTNFISELSVRIHVLIRDASPSIIQYFMSIQEVSQHVILNSVYTLRQAVLRANLPIFTYLLSLENVLDTNDKKFKILDEAVAGQSHAIFQYLIGYADFREIAAHNKNRILMSAIVKGDISRINTLLSIRQVLEAVKIDKNIMIPVMSSNQKDIIDRFLAIPELVPTLNYDHLLMAVINKNEFMVKYILSIRRIASLLVSRNHHILRSASYRSEVDIASVILEQYPATPTPIPIPIDIVSRLYHMPGSQQIKEKLFDRPLTVHGKCSDIKKIEAIKAWAQHWGLGELSAYSELDPVRWSDYLYAQMIAVHIPKSAAIIILCLHEMAAIHAKKLQPDLVPNTDESAMNKMLVKKCTKHFEEHIKPHFKEKFETVGGVEGIEKLIRTAILDKLIAHRLALAEDIKKQIEDLLISGVEDVEKIIRKTLLDEQIAHILALAEDIKQRSEALLNGEVGAMDWMYKKCQDTTDIYETCWRAYDPKATIIGFDNLLTPPHDDDHDNDVYNIPETGVRSEFKLKTGSDIIRERACYFYLVTRDERMTTDQCETATEKFFGAVAELRRSNNEDVDPANHDSPSCFPGSITHLGEIASVNPHLPPMDFALYEDLTIFFRSELDKILVKIFLRCPSKADVAQVVDALTLLTYDSVWDIIKKPWKIDCPSLTKGPDDFDDHPYEETLLAKRRSLMSQYFNVSDMLKTYAHQKPAHVSLTQHERVIIQNCIVDLARGDQALLIISYANARLLSLERIEQEQQAVGNITNITGMRRYHDEPDDDTASRNEDIHLEKKVKFE